jgi:hypothetical protein
MSRRWIAPLLVAAVALASAAPASANGWSISVQPRGDAAKLIGAGMQIYGLTREMKNRARTSQRGEGNAAAISQSGRGNNALIVQRGRGNTGTITQNGDNNSFGLFQFGRRNAADVVQSGNGRVGLTFQGGW